MVDMLVEGAVKPLMWAKRVAKLVVKAAVLMEAVICPRP